MEDIKKRIEDLFSGIEDPRVKNRCLHKLSDIIFISFCTILSGGEDFIDMEEFGNQREEWFKSVLELPNGIPTHDTFNRVFQQLDPDQLQKLLSKDGQELLGCLSGKQIAIDGKKLKGASPKSRGNKGLWVLNAWVSSNRLCVGQKKVGSKTNEIKAIPELIEELELEGAVVSIDAIGCQKAIARQLRESGADYLLAVKKNQGFLLEMVSEAFGDKQAMDLDENWEYGHGRYEERSCQILDANSVFIKDFCEEWSGINTLVKICSKRTIKDKESKEIRYYISSEKKKTAAYYNELVRGHWGIENQLHWHLDVTFKEDNCRARRLNAAENLSVIRKMVLNRIARMKDKLSLKKRRFRAALNNEYFLKLLLI